MSGRQLLIEQALFQPIKQSIYEGAGYKVENGVFKVAGKIQAANKPNANHRIYKYEILKKQVDLYIQGPVNERRAYGELDHPERATVNLQNVCHNISKIWWEGEDLYGEFEILPTPSGNILKQLFEANLTVGVSSRAVGTLIPMGDGISMVGDDLELIAWDFVSTPSTFGAYVRPVDPNYTANQLQQSYNIDEKSTLYTKINTLLSDLICLNSGVCCVR
jgi:hypothetical protein